METFMDSLNNPRSKATKVAEGDSYQTPKGLYKLIC
jgi:hypothetical protein